MALSPIAVLGCLCLLSITGVLADDCEPYIGSDLRFHGKQTCILSFCTGSCWERSCSILGSPLNQSQFLCIMNNLYMVIGLGIVISLIIVGSVIACFCKSCCLCFEMCTRPNHCYACGLTWCDLCAMYPVTSYEALYHLIDTYTAHATARVTVSNVTSNSTMVPMNYPVAAGYQPVINPPMYAGQAGYAYMPPPYPGEDNVAYMESP